MKKIDTGQERIILGPGQMNVPNESDHPVCRSVISDVLSLIGDKWTVLVVRALGGGARRFNEIKREVDGISQQMLTRTLRTLERNGLVQRTVHPTTPPQVDYALTELGRSLTEPVKQLASWALANRMAIEENRGRYDAERR